MKTNLCNNCLWHRYVSEHNEKCELPPMNVSEDGFEVYTNDNYCAYNVEPLNFHTIEKCECIPTATAWEIVKAKFNYKFQPNLATFMDKVLRVFYDDAIQYVFYHKNGGIHNYIID